MFCTRCGKELFENARFCQACGAPVAGVEVPPPVETPPAPVTEVAVPVPDEQALFEEERAFVQNCYRTINAERLAWKTVGIVWAILSAFLLLVAGMTFLAYGEEAMIQTEWQIGCAIVMLAVALVNLCMAKKARQLCETVYRDIRPVIDRYSGATLVVFSLLFNIVAMAFVLDIGGKIKSKTAVLQRIVQRQQLPQEI